MTGLDLLDVPPSVEKCKLEIRKKGAKLEFNWRTTALRRARMAQQEQSSWTYPDYP